ncbi:MAG: N-acetylmuramoyl-L-alanine amidase [Planctomycetes bacterium]|nr:N-acetylmuramoyl-L-alanine amidase [Planctomycetota bacterium]
MATRLYACVAATFAATICAAAPASAVDRPAIKQRPAHSSNFTPAKRSFVNTIVIHKAEGENASGWFQSPRANASAHYDVQKDGTIYQSVANHDIAWHAGNWEVNQRSIGIEHGGFTARADTTAAQYRASARLVAYLCERYTIPIDRRHIIGHSEVPDPNTRGAFGGASRHTDPGRHWRWDHFLSLVRSYANATPPPPAPAPAGDPVLRQGDKGPAVVALQDLLRARGFWSRTSHGTFGSLTAAKVRGFQRSRFLSVNGVANAATWRELRQAAKGEDATGKVAVTKGLRSGDSGPHVLRVQRYLRRGGYAPGPLDGDFGPVTERAVKALQRDHGLRANGVVNGPTWTALVEEKRRGDRVAQRLAEFSRKAPKADYTRVRVAGPYGSVQLNRRTKELLDRAKVIMRQKYRHEGFAFQLVQGSYNRTVAASGGTHDGGGAIDVRTRGMSRTTVDHMVQSLRQAGFAAWSRGRGHDPFDPHIHGIALGDRQATRQAKSQVTDYRRGLNGLVNRAADPDRSLGRPIPVWAR